MTSTAILDQSDTIDKARVGYIDGLRQLADLLEQSPDLALPSSGTATSGRLLTYVYGDDPKASVAAWARAVGKANKRVDDNFFHLEFSLAGLHMQVYASRGEVCERVVTGTETVTKTVKDPDALKAVPEIEVTETVETVEWICPPLLSAAQ